MQREHQDAAHRKVSQHRCLRWIGGRVVQVDRARLSAAQHLGGGRELRDEETAAELERAAVGRMLGDLDEHVADHARHDAAHGANVCVELLAQPRRQIPDGGAAVERVCRFLPQTL